MAASGMPWIAFVAVLVFFMISVSFAVVLTVRERCGVSRRSALPEALNKAANGGIFLAVAVGMYVPAHLFRVSHAEWLAAPLAGLAVGFLQPDKRRKTGSAVSAVALAAGAVLFADLLQACGVAHPTLFTFAAVAVAACAISLSTPLKSVARRLWLGL